jgi:cation:H+ antiporter
VHSGIAVPMLVDLALLGLGAVLLYVGAEGLVKGAAGLGVAFGMRPVVVGLTIVAYATSMPELAVSAAAALRGSSAIALGNVVGSNIANIGLVLGLATLIAPARERAALTRGALPSLALTTVVTPLLMMNGVIGRLEGVLLLAGAAAFTFLTVRGAGRTSTAEDAGEKPKSKLWLVGLTLGGLALLVGGGEVFVRGAVGVAEDLGMSERVVGLTIVAVGTSLPELAASVVGALRGHTAMIVGNVIGSNIFNVLFILGATGTIRPIGGSIFDMRLELLALAVAVVLALLFLRGGRPLVRLEGAVLVAGYAGFLIALALGVTL